MNPRHTRCATLLLAAPSLRFGIWRSRAWAVGAAIAACLGAAPAASALTDALIVAPDGAPEDHFGKALALSGDTLIVGADQDDDLGNRSGAAYVFSKTPGGWALEQKILMPGGAAEAQFGYAVAIDSNRAVIGALGASGGLFVYERTAGSWTFQQKISRIPLSDFGESGDGRVVAVSGDTIAFASGGSVFVYVLSAGVWAEQQEIADPNPPVWPSDDRYFGASIGLSGEFLIIGAVDLADWDPVAGVFIYARSGGVWTQEMSLDDQGDWFGSSVAISGDTAVVGWPNTNAALAGFARVYFRDGGGVWSYQETLYSPTPADHPSQFGCSVSIDGDLMVIGEDSYFEAGKAFVFERSGALWSAVREVGSFSSAANDDFGRDVSISGEQFAVGNCQFFNSGNGETSVFAAVLDPWQASDIDDVFPFSDYVYGSVDGQNGWTGDALMEWSGSSGDRWMTLADNQFAEKQYGVTPASGGVEIRFFGRWSGANSTTYDPAFEWMLLCDDMPVVSLQIGSDGTFRFEDAAGVTPTDLTSDYGANNRFSVGLEVLPDGTVNGYIARKHVFTGTAMNGTNGFNGTRFEAPVESSSTGRQYVIDDMAAANFVITADGLTDWLTGLPAIEDIAGLGPLDTTVPGNAVHGLGFDVLAAVDGGTVQWDEVYWPDAIAAGAPSGGWDGGAMKIAMASPMVSVGLKFVRDLGVTSTLVKVYGSDGSLLEQKIFDTYDDTYAPDDLFLRFRARDALIGRVEVISTGPHTVIVKDFIGYKVGLDSNGDGVVSGADLAVMLAGWGTTNPLLDVNGDGVVNGADLAELLASWGGPGF